MQTRFKILLLCSPLLGCGISSLSDIVDSDTVPTSDIVVKTSGSLFEADGLLSVSLNLRTTGFDKIKLSPNATLDFQIARGDGSYETINTIEEEVFDFSFHLDNHHAPATYRIVFRRANGEEVELITLTFNANLVATSSITNQAIGANDSIDFSWSWESDNTPVNIANPDILLQYTLQCDGIYHNGDVEVPPSVGTSANPFTLHIPDIVANHTSIEFPCEARFGAASFSNRDMELNSLLSATIGDGLANSGSVVDDSLIWFYVYVEDHFVTIE